MADAADVKRLRGFPDRGNPDELLKNAKIMPAGVALGETLEVPGFGLSSKQGRVHARFQRGGSRPRFSQLERGDLLHESLVVFTGHDSTSRGTPLEPSPTNVQSLSLFC